MLSELATVTEAVDNTSVYSVRKNGVIQPRYADIAYILDSIVSWYSVLVCIPAEDTPSNAQISKYAVCKLWKSDRNCKVRVSVQISDTVFFSFFQVGEFVLIVLDVRDLDIIYVSSSLYTFVQIHTNIYIYIYNLMDSIEPSFIKSCTRCRERKVKCDMHLPICKRCTARKEDCDVKDMIMYDFDVVEKLQSRVKELESKLKEYEGALPASKKPKKLNYLNESIQESVGVEVGILDSESKTYFGTASGIAFTNVFLNQLSFKFDNKSVNVFNELNFNPSVLKIENFPIISLPPKNVVFFLLETYLENIQVFYPIISLNHILKTIDNLYSAPKEVSANDKFMLFMILAISSEYSQNNKKYISLNDPNTSREYFSYAFKYINETIANICMDSIRNLLLLTIWCLCLQNIDENENVWVLTRHTTSLCIQCGFHRKNSKWKLTPFETEMRNRLWWSCFILERLVAVQTGRTLSIRNYAIDCDMPVFNDDLDKHDLSYNLKCPFYNSSCFEPLYLLAKVRSISGDILESVYVARGESKTLAIESIYKSASRLREELDLWLESVMDLYLTYNKNVYQTLRLQYNVCSLSLSRPSASFPTITKSASKICLNDSKSFIDIVTDQINSNTIFDFWLIASNILTVSVTFLFSSWVLNADFKFTEGYVQKIQQIIKFLTKNSVLNLNKARFFNSILKYALEHLNKADSNLSNIFDSNTEFDTLEIEDDEERRVFILNYLLNISGGGPFTLIQQFD